MTNPEIQASIDDYELVAFRERRPTPDGRTIFYAMFREVPECLAEGPSIEDAMADLRMMIQPYLAGILADGGVLPVAIAKRQGVNAGGMVIESLSIAAVPAGDTVTGGDPSPEPVRLAQAAA